MQDNILIFVYLIGLYQLVKWFVKLTKKLISLIKAGIENYNWNKNKKEWFK